MKTTIIKVRTPQLRDDLIYVKFYKSENLTYERRESPSDMNVDEILECFRLQDIERSIEGGTVTSTSSKIVYDKEMGEPVEEITINYDELVGEKIKLDKEVYCPVCKSNHYKWVWELKVK